MKLITIWTGIAFAGYATAQSCDAFVSAVPSCAATCINSAASAVGCTAGDLGCQCSSSQSSAINSLAINCVVAGCGIPTALAASASANAVCKCAATAVAATTTASAAITSAASPSASTSIAPLTTTAAPLPTTTSVKSIPYPSAGSYGSYASAGSYGSYASGTVEPGATSCVEVKAATSSPDCSQQVAKIPSCALTCFSNAIAAIGCAHTDYACQCSSANMASLTSEVTPCVLSSCSSADALEVQAAAAGVCTCANDWVLKNPKATTCYAIGGASVSVSGSGSGSFAPGSSIPPSSFYATTKAASTTTTAVAQTATSSAISSATSSSLPQVTGAAGRVSIGAGMVGAAVFAAFAL
ncbi:GPI-anchored CFEM domain protein [Lachnellula suecica]|uniref:GPI-anchored CFEM domain protein n=1 Tax=Lachnellula suecica TaxID=602035 RepID=A0A8T9CD73_9HELO|nr:GPI-anchored CFEM domain protein [Lachnellula suecica]